MYLYIFGSFCRGEIDQYSDVDLLIIKENNEFLPNFNLDKYSIYNKDRIQDLWLEGNPFAWHLFLESKLIFSNDKLDFIRELGTPNSYKNLKVDLTKFYKLFKESSKSLVHSPTSRDFDLSMIFLAIRNFASCYSLGHLEQYNFSRSSAKRLGDDSIKLSEKCYLILEKSRILSTRGIGNNATKEECQYVIEELPIISQWFNTLMSKVVNE